MKYFREFKLKKEKKHVHQPFGRFSLIIQRNSLVVLVNLSVMLVGAVTTVVRGLVRASGCSGTGERETTAVRGLVRASVCSGTGETKVVKVGASSFSGTISVEITFSPIVFGPILSKPSFIRLSIESSAARYTISIGPGGRFTMALNTSADDMAMSIIAFKFPLSLRASPNPGD